MENLDNNFEKADPWREAILAERRRGGQEPMLVKALDNYGGKRENALILGDASLVQSNYLLEEQNFGHVVDVDSSPTLLDDVIVKKDDPRLERVLKTFDEYDPSSEKFDLIYGKSIAFNPKATIGKLLENLSNALNDGGIFYAVFAGDGDIYRHGIFYSQKEIEELYAITNLEILEIEEIKEHVSGLLGRPGQAHRFEVLAKKK